MSVWPRSAKLESDFSHARYAEMLEAVMLDRPVFCFADLKKAGKEPRFALWRHDCEVSLAAAEEMSEIDFQHRIRSTFFLLLSSEYNVFEREQAGRIERILRRGHDIGLHYDLNLVRQSPREALDVVLAQKELLEKYFSVKVSAISEHIPSGVYFRCPRVVDAYRLPIPNVEYFSDSGQVWRDLFWRKCGDRIQVLTHPDCWSAEGHGFETKLLMDAKIRFDDSWRRTEEWIARMRVRLPLRTAADKRKP